MGWPSSHGWVSLAAAAAGVVGAGMMSHVPPTVSAAQLRCQDFGAYFTGAFTTYQTSIFGSRAQIETSNPDLCDLNYNSSTVWSMVSSHSEEDPNAQVWAQTGYGNFGEELHGPAGRHVFAQFTNACKPGCPGRPATTMFAPAPSGSTFYANYLRASDNHIHMTAAGIKILETDYNPANYWRPAWRAEFFGEVRDRDTDMVGTIDDKVHLDHLQRYEPNGDINFIQTLNVADAAGDRFHVDRFDAASGGHGLKLWTHPIY